MCKIRGETEEGPRQKSSCTVAAGSSWDGDVVSHRNRCMGWFREDEGKRLPSDKLQPKQGGPSLIT